LADGRQGEAKLRASAALGGRGMASVAFPVEVTGERSDCWKNRIRGGERVRRYALCLSWMPFFTAHYVICWVVNSD
jgi:hypothetical protein